MVTRNNARGVALAFTVVMVLALAMQMVVMYSSAILCDARTRPSVWISWGFSSFLMAANIGFIITWMVAAATDNVRRMRIGLTGVAVRLVGTAIYIIISRVEAGLSKQTVSEKAATPLHVGENLFEGLWVIPAVIMFGIECGFVVTMAGYTESCKAAIDAKKAEEEEEPREKSDGNSSSGAPAAGPSNN
ncbi:uncharacterized protein LOC142573944 [Dermacentor variabilis]|uniref:uncharacterized protein LOC142573944 n=1 Tax=Dermacentor variabilis TaxID=34621 RepID=UPI003F5C2303